MKISLVLGELLEAGTSAHHEIPKHEFLPDAALIIPIHNTKQCPMNSALVPTQYSETAGTNFLDVSGSTGIRCQERRLARHLTDEPTKATGTNFPAPNAQRLRRRPGIVSTAGAEQSKWIP